MTSTTSSSSSADIVPFPQQKFESWREHWHRQVLADPELSDAAKSVAGFLLWHLNRESRNCFVLYETVATGTAMSRRSAKRNMRELIEHEHIRRESRPGKSNLLFPIQGGVKSDTPGVTDLTPPGVSNLTPITSDFLTSESNRSSDNGAPVCEGGAGKISPPRFSGAKKNGGPALAFAGQVIRVTAEQLDRWKRAFPLVPDIVAELQVADDYFVQDPKGRGKWFFRASAWLKRTNDKRLEAKNRIDAEDLSF